MGDRNWKRQKVNYCPYKVDISDTTQEYDDPSYDGFDAGQIITLTGGAGQIELPAVYDKLILKLYDANGVLLIDEAIFGELPPGTLLAWRMNEGSGPVANDSAPDDAYRGLTLGDDYVWAGGCPNIPSDVGLAAPNDCNSYCLGWIHPHRLYEEMTLSAWVKFGAIDTAGSYVITIADKYQLYVDSDTSTVQMSVYTEDDTWRTAQAEPLGAGVSVTDGNWHYIAGTYSGFQDASGNANICLYWDGQLVDTYSFAVGPGGLFLKSTGTGNICVGTNANNIGQADVYFIGSGIDEVIIGSLAVTSF